MDWEARRLAIRSRPAMYVGNTNVFGLFSLFSEALENSMDEAVAGRARQIDVVLHADGSLSVTDDGRGIPVEIVSPFEAPGVTVAFTEFSSLAQLRRGEPHLAKGYGIAGVVCLNALSLWLEVTTWQNSKSYFQRFERGAPVAALHQIDEAPVHPTGTRVRWFPDPELFREVHLSRTTIRDRLRTLAYLVGGTCITFLDEGEERREVFQSETGLAEYVELLNTGHQRLFDPVQFSEHRENMHLDVALQYRRRCPPVTLLSFANHRHTPEGGSHERGFWKAMREVMSSYARTYRYLGADSPDLSSRQVSTGLTAVLSVRLADLQLAGPTKEILGNAEVGPRMRALVRDGLRSFLERNPEVWKGVLWEWQFHSARFYVADKAIRWRLREDEVATLEAGSGPPARG